MRKRNKEKQKYKVRRHLTANQAWDRAVDSSESQRHGTAATDTFPGRGACCVQVRAGGRGTGWAWAPPRCCTSTTVVPHIQGHLGAVKETTVKWRKWPKPSRWGPSLAWLSLTGKIELRRGYCRTPEPSAPQHWLILSLLYLKALGQGWEQNEGTRWLVLGRSREGIYFQGDWRLRI